MSPLEQLRAWALFTVQKEDGGEEAVNYAAIAARVTKVGGGEPTREAIRQHIERVEKDPDTLSGWIRQHIERARYAMNEGDTSETRELPLCLRRRCRRAELRCWRPSAAALLARRAGA